MAPAGPRRAALPVALVPEEPAGRISTTCAGAAFFEATLRPRPGDGLSAPALGDAPPSARFFAAWESDPVSSSYRFSCEVRALRTAALAASLEGLLRAMPAHAALADAGLEARAVGLAVPVVPPASLVQGLARDLWAAGLPVGFGPSWAPAAGAAVAVGTGGDVGEIEAFLRAHPRWCSCGESGAGLARAGMLDLRSASG